MNIAFQHSLKGGGCHNFQYFDHTSSWLQDWWKRFRNFFSAFKKSQKFDLIFFRIEISLHLGVPDNQSLLQFSVPDKQMLLHFGVSDNWSMNISSQPCLGHQSSCRGHPSRVEFDHRGHQNRVKLGCWGRLNGVKFVCL